MLADTAFREARWRRAGASDTQIEDLRAAHADLSADEKAAEAARIDTISDSDLAVELDGDTTNLALGTKDQVLERVGDDADLAAVALSHEQARARPRKTVIDALNAVIAQDG